MLSHLPDESDEKVARKTNPSAKTVFVLQLQKNEKHNLNYFCSNFHLLFL